MKALDVIECPQASIEMPTDESGISETDDYIT
jgi:hypothetical protein